MVDDARENNRPHSISSSPDGQEAHAAARLARALVLIIDSGKDPRTVRGWGRCALASSGALRNWCRTARIAPRRCLVFGRLLRAVVRSDGGRHKLENLLAVVDLRTLSGLLRFAGFSGQDDFPRDTDEFLQRQTLICDPDALLEIRRALEERDQRSPQLAERAAHG
jgi:hypothetical protein